MSNPFPRLSRRGEAKTTDKMENIGFISVLVLIALLFGVSFLMCKDKCLRKGKKDKVGAQSGDNTFKS